MFFIKLLSNVKENIGLPFRQNQATGVVYKIVFAASFCKLNEL